MKEILYSEALEVLKNLIRIPSFSKEENLTADLIQKYLESKGQKCNRHMNNVWVVHPDFKPGRPTLLLNSHHDTVKPTSSWTLDPFTPTEVDGKLIGLGSNDAGAPLVSLMATYLYFAQKPSLNWNLIYAATAEEEISGHHGIECIKDQIEPISLAIVGEPTTMELAIAEKGLMVLDCKASGRPGHAAREEGENAIYNALPDIEWIRTFQFPEVSKVLGPVKMSVTQIKAGYQHNLVPDVCEFVVDVRPNEHYSNAETLEIIRQNVKCEVTARSLRLNSSFIPLDHPLVKIANAMKINCYGSPTSSDQAVMPWTSVKMGPGDSARSHTANEFIYPEEIKNGIDVYIEILEKLEF
jgi:acetylornithine deacetylase